jgi:hypothetical protein
MTDDTPLPFDLSAVRRKKRTIDFEALRGKESVNGGATCRSRPSRVQGLLPAGWLTLPGGTQILWSACERLFDDHPPFLLSRRNLIPANFIAWEHPDTFDEKVLGFVKRHKAAEVSRRVSGHRVGERSSRFSTPSLTCGRPRAGWRLRRRSTFTKPRARRRASFCSR